MTYIKISPKMKAKDAAALPDLVATLDRIAADDTRKAEEAIGAMPAKLTPGQRRYLRRDALQSRVLAQDMVKRLEASAKEAELLATVGKLTSADRRWLRHHLAVVGSLGFVKL